MPAFPTQTSLERRIGVVLVLFVAIMGFGATGYRLIEGWSWLDALYMAAITITTVGFAETHPLSEAGRLFTIAMVVLGVGAFTYTFSTLGEYLIAGHLQGYLAQRKMKRESERLKDHYIICGYGRVGAEVAREFQREGQPMVVVDVNGQAVEAAHLHTGCLSIHGDAGEDEVLREAGIERAKALIAAADSDATNVMIALSAHAIHPQLFIVARANSEESRSKLVRAGAHRIISPAIIGGRSMAQMAIRPDVVEFLDVVTRDDEMEFWIEVLNVAPGSRMDGATVGSANVRQATGVTLLTLRRQGERRVILPTPETTLHAGDMIMAFGNRQQLARLQELVA